MMQTKFYKRIFFLLLLMAWAVVDTAAAFRFGRSAEQDLEKSTAVESARTSFAPMPAEHPLANIWNDPEFTRRLIGSYGFLSEAEPRLNAEEQLAFTETIVPLLREDTQKAIPELKSRIKPEASAVFDYTLGTVYFQSGDLTNAVKYYEQALAKFPDYRRAQKNLGLALFRDGRYEESIQPLSRTISMGAGDGGVFGLLGFAYLNQGNHLSALAAYTQAMLYEPDMIDYKLGIVKCQIALAYYPAALALLDELLAKYPDRANLWALQANLFVQTEQNTRAAVNFEILRKMGKASAVNLMMLGDLYVAQESPDLALSAYREAIEKDGARNLAGALRAAGILTSRGAWTEATALFKQIRDSAGVSIETEDELQLLKLEAKVAMANNAGEQAIGVLERIIQRNPLDGEALLLAGEYYGRNGEREKAEFRFESASKISGFEADGLLKLAQLQVRSQKYVRAAELLRQAQKIRPRDNVQRYLEKVEQAALASRS
jgi:tetratricopeptide (TPR) repeat protein